MAVICIWQSQMDTTNEENKTKLGCQLEMDIKFVWWMLALHMEQMPLHNEPQGFT